MQERLANLERQIGELLRGNVAVAARADGAPVVTADSSAIGGAIRLVLSELRREVPYDSCSVQELRGDRLVIVGGVGFADLDVLLGESFDVENSDIPNSEVIYRRRPLIVSDTEQYRAFRRGLHVGDGIRSWLGVPLLHGEHLLGMLALDKAEPDSYSHEHAQMALAFAALVARALFTAADRSLSDAAGC
ncbi:MAG TPA: GAF domain-containing protein [Thermoanaerobaculia bacterium]|nr:GAF domain-containing protein [Thermoanaerobaculia bacterium]